MYITHIILYYVNVYYTIIHVIFSDREEVLKLSTRDGVVTCVVKNLVRTSRGLRTWNLKYFLNICFSPEVLM